MDCVFQPPKRFCPGVEAFTLVLFDRLGDADQLALEIVVSHVCAFDGGPMGLQPVGQRVPVFDYGATLPHAVSTSRSRGRVGCLRPTCDTETSIREANMKRIIVELGLCVLLVACGGTVTLLADGKAHRGKFDALAKSLEVTIDGKRYVGNYVTNAGSSAGGFFLGTKYVANNSVSSATQGRAILVSNDNQTLRCEFAVQGMSAQGACQDSSGKFYDMIAGQ